MTRRIVDIALLLALVAVICAVPGYAKAAATQATDPSANSPAGVLYAIPLDSARQDAAPHFASGHGSGGSTGEGGGSGAPGAASAGAGGGPGGGSSGSAGGSAATSSSGHADSQAAGAGSGSSHTDGRSTAAAKTDPILVPGAQPGSLVHSTNGFGSSSTVPGLHGESSPGLGAVQGNASDAPLLAGVLTFILLSVGGYLGVRAWRRTPGPGPEASSRA